MPAAAVIPALIAYIKVVAVKKLVVGFWGRSFGQLLLYCLVALFLPCDQRHSLVVVIARIVYCEKIRVFKAGVCLNTLAWNNGIGLRTYFVGF